MTLLADLEEFVHDHRPHGRLIADATPPAWDGYLFRVSELRSHDRIAQLAGA
jgi:hypothetical protein